MDLIETKVDQQGIEFLPFYIVKVWDYELADMMYELEGRIEKGGSVAHMQTLLDEYKALKTIRETGKVAKQAARQKA